MPKPCFLLNLDIAHDLLDERRPGHVASRQAVEFLQSAGCLCYLATAMLPLLEHLEKSKSPDRAEGMLQALAAKVKLLPSGVPAVGSGGGTFLRAVVESAMEQMPEMLLLTYEEACLTDRSRAVRPGEVGVLPGPGGPVTDIPFQDFSGQHQELVAEIDAAFRRVLSSRWYVFGRDVEAFEQEFASYVGTRHCVSVGNGLDAMILVLRAWGIGPGDEVIVPAQTYVATWMAVSAVGAKPVPAEVDVDTCNLDPGFVEAAITPATRALLPVHLFGHPADMFTLRAIARRHGLLVLEDCAQAHGAEHQGRKCGSLGDAGAFSFYPGKNLGGFGDGGAVTTDDDVLADRLRALRNYGSRKKYEHEVIGTNSRLDSLQAAFLRIKLGPLDAWNQRRANLASQYCDRLSQVENLRLPVVKPGCQSAWHLFVVRHPQRDRLAGHLRECGIGTLVHYPTPPWLSGAYRSQFSAGGSWPVGEEWARTCLSLPLGPHNTVAEISRVCDALLSFD